MFKKINTLHDALTFQLQGLVYAEHKLTDEFTKCSEQIESVRLKTEIKNYVDSGASKLLKLERIFNYLMQDCQPRKNQVVNKLIEETQHMLTYTTSPHLKDILMIGCIQNINAYKIASYKTAYMFAIEMNLDTAEDLVQQILEWELEANKTFTTLAIEEFNKHQVTY
jgi:ferritin-like metal-binding protein YciE